MLPKSECMLNQVEPKRKQATLQIRSFSKQPAVMASVGPNEASCSGHINHLGRTQETCWFQKNKHAGSTASHRKRPDSTHSKRLRLEVKEGNERATKSKSATCSRDCIRKRRWVRSRQ
jgi:hypothetical protein